MKQLYILFISVLIILTGCETKEETIKSEYIAMKNQTFDEENYENTDIELPFEIITTVERIDEETINYEVLVTNPKENMYDVKVMVVHNSYNEDVFPSIGVFNETRDLLIEPEKASGELVLSDTIQSTENISKLDLKFKIWVEYFDEFGEKKDIYYKTT